LGSSRPAPDDQRRRPVFHIAAVPDRPNPSRVRAVVIGCYVNRVISPKQPVERGRGVSVAETNR
jgi:hypothetical protein